MVANFEVGDVVRVRAARRRDVLYRVAEVSSTHVRAVNDRGAEAFYLFEHFEHVDSRKRPHDDRSSADVRGDAFESRELPAELSDRRYVVPYPGEFIDSLLRRFKKATQKSGILTDARRHEHFISKGRRRREKSLRARKRRA